MTSEHSSVIREHVNACISRCYKADLPLACLAELMDGLRSDGCTNAEIHQIEQAVFKLLAGIVSPVRHESGQVVMPVPLVNAPAMPQLVS